MAGATKHGKRDTARVSNGSSPLVRSSNEDSTDAPTHPSFDLAETQVRVARLTEVLGEGTSGTVLQAATVCCARAELL